MADYVVETNRGRYITREEAQIFQRAEDNGFVHQITNIDGENKIFAICNCNVKNATPWHWHLFNTPNLSAPRIRRKSGRTAWPAASALSSARPAP